MQPSRRRRGSPVRAYLVGLVVLFALGPERSLDDGVTLIQKPFDERTLLEQVHTVLTAPAAFPVPRPASLTARSHRTAHGP